MAVQNLSFTNLFGVLDGGKQISPLQLATELNTGEFFLDATLLNANNNNFVAKGLFIDNSSDGIAGLLQINSGSPVNQTFTIYPNQIAFLPFFVGNPAKFTVNWEFYQSADNTPVISLLNWAPEPCVWGNDVSSPVAAVDIVGPLNSGGNVVVAIEKSAIAQSINDNAFPLTTAMQTILPAGSIKNGFIINNGNATATISWGFQNATGRNTTIPAGDTSGIIESPTLDMSSLSLGMKASVAGANFQLLYW